MNLLPFFRRKASHPSQPVTPPDSPGEPPQLTALKTLVIVYDPVVDRASGKKLSQFMNWNKVDDLMKGYIADIQQVSGGLVQYQITERIDVDAFPAKIDGYVYDAQTFMNVLRGVSHPYMPQEADYYAIIEHFNVLQRVANNEIDEVWVFNFPHAGFYDSTMAGPNAFWCNGPAIKDTASSKRHFVVMGFNFERDVGCMLENFGHRVESVMRHVFRHHPPEQDLFARFTRYDETHPSGAHCGNVHFAPNSRPDYDWGNRRQVWSYCDDWLDFPDLAGRRRLVDARDWGGGDMRLHLTILCTFRSCGSAGTASMT